MRKTVIVLGMGLGVLFAVALCLMPGGVQAQGDPTPTINLSGILGGATATPQADESMDTNALQLVWVRVEAGFGAMNFDAVTVGGPVDTYAFVGDPCAQGAFSAMLPVFEFHLLSDTGAVRIGYVADDGSATALLMWDEGQETWWCTTELEPGAEMNFESMMAGDYPIYVGVEGGGPVTGALYIEEG
ncbi:hypothetical protein [Aggregatilinea lenta]|uniref:hypothetical protein n=1 Tax=Aggregatilinea lenta TaxID=913108 RepID=UPI0013C2E37D|nr:hypothetical protein [Aggregatilinea lenta]